MRQKSVISKKPAEKVVRDIRNRHANLLMYLDFAGSKFRAE